jgi:dihydropteroate synthase
MQKSFFRKNKTLNIGGKILNITQPLVMGILNLTPDSFHASSRVANEKELLSKAEQMLSEGAFFLDLGAYSTRPGAEDIAPEEEIKRLLPAVSVLKRHFPEAILSVDTFRKSVAEAAFNEGAAIINDISGGQADDEMFDFCAQKKLPYVLMHSRGNPQNMTKLTAYEDIVAEMLHFFGHRINLLQQKGLNDIIIDPGFGFAKNIQQNFFLLKHLDTFAATEKLILVGLSRKSMIYKTLDITPENALNGTSVLNTIALSKGADILRVHDVKEAVEAIKLHENMLYSF